MHQEMTPEALHIWAAALAVMAIILAVYVLWPPQSKK